MYILSIGLHNKEAYLTLKILFHSIKELNKMPLLNYYNYNNLIINTKIVKTNLINTMTSIYKLSETELDNYNHISNGIDDNSIYMFAAYKSSNNKIFDVYIDFIYKINSNKFEVKYVKCGIIKI